MKRTAFGISITKVKRIAGRYPINERPAIFNFIGDLSIQHPKWKAIRKAIKELEVDLCRRGFSRIESLDAINDAADIARSDLTHPKSKQMTRVIRRIVSSVKREKEDA